MRKAPHSGGFDAVEAVMGAAPVDESAMSPTTPSGSARRRREPRFRGVGQHVMRSGAKKPFSSPIRARSAAYQADGAVMDPSSSVPFRNSCSRGSFPDRERGLEDVLADEFGPDLVSKGASAAMLKKEFKSKDRIVESLQKKLSAAIARAEALDQENATLHATVAELQDTVEEMQTHALEKAATEREREAALRKTSDALSERLSATSALLVSAEADLKGAREEAATSVAKLAQELEACHARIGVLETRVRRDTMSRERLEAAMMRSSESLRTSTRDIERRDVSLDEAHEMIAQLERDLDAERELHGTAIESALGTEERICALEEKLQASAKQLAAEMSQTRELRASLAKATAEAGTLRSRAAEPATPSSSRVVKLERHVESLQASLDAQRRAYALLLSRQLPGGSAGLLEGLELALTRDGAPSPPPFAREDSNSSFSSSDLASARRG